MNDDPLVENYFNTLWLARFVQEILPLRVLYRLQLRVIERRTARFKLPLSGDYSDLVDKIGSASG